MCGIIGMFHNSDVKKKIAAGLREMENRGKDASHLYTTKEHGIGHNLLAIVNTVPQPLENKFIANCEIYNWEKLKKKYNVQGENDAEVIFRIIEKHGVEKIEEFDGVFALTYWNKNKVHLARDILGVKPIWFCPEPFAFASEKKVLEKLGFTNIEELNPRKILTYDLDKKEITFAERPFFSLKELKDGKKILKEGVKRRLLDAVKKRIPDQKIGVLFSGGIDSTIICYILHQSNIPFTCYTAAVDEEGMKTAEDLVYAEKIAKQYGWELKVKKIKLKDVPKYLKKIVPLIEDSNVVKVGVALPFFLSCEEAKKDKVKVIFSGLGSEEIFAGYERHDKASNINEECLFGLKQMYQRDLYRDDVVTMYNTIELRLPFLDHELVQYGLNIPAKYKIKGGDKKVILREVCEEMGLEKEYAFRKKKAAQYGSKFDKALEKLARKEGVKKSSYLRKFYPSHNLRLGVLMSGGKDNILAAYILHQMNYDITCGIVMESKNKDSYMFHTPNIDVVSLQAEAMNIPLVKGETEGEKEIELKDLYHTIKLAKKEFHLDGIVTGALFSTYQRNRIEKICDELGLKVFSPLWHKDQEEEMKELLNLNFKIMFSAIACDGLNKSWFNRVIELKDVEKLIKMHKKIGTNIAGEGGEFETLVLDCPLFQKKIKILDAEIVMENEYTGKFIVKEAVLE